VIKEPIVESRKFHEIWIEQCEAAEEIKLRYGLKAAFDYLVAEKLFNFADAAKTHPAFARELPQFVARVRGLFTVEEMRTHLNRIQCEAYIGERDELDEEGEQGGGRDQPRKPYGSHGARSAIRNYSRVIDCGGARDLVRAGRVDALAAGGAPYRNASDSERVWHAIRAAGSSVCSTAPIRCCTCGKPGA
jgi:hypothetical protein